MKKLAVYILLTSLCFVFVSCDKQIVNPSDNITTQTHNFSDFTAFEVSSDFDVTVEFSEDDDEVRIEANENLHEHIIVEKEGDKLIVRMDAPLSIRGNSTTKIFIRTAEINDFKATGDCTIKLTNTLETEQETNITLTGDSEFSGDVNVKNLYLKATGDAQFELSGSANFTNIKLTGDCEMKDYHFECQDANLDLTGESKVYLTVQNSMDIKATGESNIYYKGNGSISQQNVTGEAKIKNMN